MIRRVALALVLVACGNRHRESAPPEHHDAGSAEIAIPVAPPLPAVPLGLPAMTLPAEVTPAAVALGERLFRDARLASDGKTTCATCHDPAHGFAGHGRQPIADGHQNLREAPALVNLAWKREFGWDGRFGSLATQLQAHARGQLGRPLEEPELAALRAYCLTRYAGDSPWDRVERSPDAPAELKAGYALFTGKAQCAQCHAPPLYTDLGYHRLGLIAVPDEGRGRIEPAKLGAFATPTLRGAAARASFFHDGSATSLDAAIDWHLAGGTGDHADPSIVDVKAIALTADERKQLGAFVRALTGEVR
ncbi:MAG TPA: cytochrome c peroxidase [Kofleriaceae bacterium]